MIRVLQCVNNMHRAGLETMLMNYYRNIDRTKIQFDFLTHRPDRSDYDDEIEALGGRIYRAPRLYPQNYPAYFAYMRKFFREHPEYKIVHSHIDAMSYLPLLAAKRAGVPVRIAHSHSTSIDRDYKFLLKQLFRFKIPDVANCLVACGDAAGDFLFRGKEFMIIPNAIEIDKFYFNPHVREKMRKAMGLLDDTFVIGHVGRFTYAKNHVFLIDVFEEIKQKKKNAHLLLVGEGELREKLEEYIAEKQLTDSVTMTGSVLNPEVYYQMFDVLIFPSHYEGLGMVVVEAQAAGVPCVVSHAVPEDVVISNEISFLELTESAQKWADTVVHFYGAERRRMGERVKQHKYNIANAVEQLKSFYLNLENSLERV